MKTKSIFLVFAITISIAFAMNSSAAAQTVGYVNLSKVFDAYNKTKEFDANLQTEAEAKRGERDAIVEGIKSLRDDLELLSADGRAEKQGEVDARVQELQAFDNDSRLELRRKRDTMIRDILKEIDDIIQEYGKENGYDYIYNDRILLYKTDQSDLTETITEILNG
ncbi:MAG: outer membrane protein [Candidatus Omnitrophota bacterium]|jgi:outer membrane protein